MKYDTIVIGAGAAGLMAAGTAAQTGAKVLLLEKMEKPARKVRITGKGRCNITNMKQGEDFFSHIRTNRDFFAPSFDKFSNEHTFDFFRSIGVELIAERGGRVFPASGRAQDVAEALVKWCAKMGVEVRCQSRVVEILHDQGRIAGVRVEKNEIIESGSVVLCTGGASYPATGSTGDGYKLAYDLGHNIEALRPSLVALYSSHHSMRSMQGLLLKNVSAALTVNGKVVATEFGEVEFTRDRSDMKTTQMAGAIILKLSRDAVDALIEDRQVEIVLDLKPAISIETLTARIGREMQALKPSDKLESLLRKLMPSQLVEVIARELHLPFSSRLISINENVVNQIALSLKKTVFHITDYATFDEAVITAGGVQIREIDSLTLESKKIKGLYFAGEILDLDADTGGYNLQIAFSTGRLAGESATYQKLD